MVCKDQLASFWADPDPMGMSAVLPPELEEPTTFTRGTLWPEAPKDHLRVQYPIQALA